jgi:ubiquinone/menaquinone biosynthesis C-methylase UbiE
MAGHPAPQRPETSGIVISTPLEYDLQMRHHTSGREARFRAEQVRRARLTSGDRVLDIGSGTGGLTIALARAVGPGGSAVGVEPSPEMVARAVAKARRRRSAATFEVGIIEALPFADATMDVVTLSLVLHQLPSDAFHRGMVEVRRVLKPGGRLLAVDMGGPQDPDRATSHAPHGSPVGRPPFDLDRVSMFFEHLGFELIDQGPIRFSFVDLERLRYVLARRGS